MLDCLYLDPHLGVVQKLLSRDSLLLSPRPGSSSTRGVGHHSGCGGREVAEEGEQVLVLGRGGGRGRGRGLARLVNMDGDAAAESARLPALTRLVAVAGGLSRGGRRPWSACCRRRWWARRPACWTRTRCPGWSWWRPRGPTWSPHCRR